MRLSGNCLKSLVAVMIVGIGLAGPAHAATVRINPTKIRLSIPAGESQSGVVEVENSSEESLLVKAYLADWKYTPAQDGTKEFFTAGMRPDSAAAWISTSVSEFVIPPKGSQSISYTVKVPLNAQGGHYAVLFFETFLSGSQPEDTTQLGVVVRIGALFYIEPQGTIKRQAELSNLKIERNGSSEPLAVALDISNTGNVDITTEATFHLIDTDGLVVGRGSLNDAYTFAGEKARLTGRWSEPVSAGAYDLVLTVNLGKGLEMTEVGRAEVITAEVDVDIGIDGSVVSVGNMR